MKLNFFHNIEICITRYRIRLVMNETTVLCRCLVKIVRYAPRYKFYQTILLAVRLVKTEKNLITVMNAMEVSGIAEIYTSTSLVFSKKLANLKPR